MIVTSATSASCCANHRRSPARNVRARNIPFSYPSSLRHRTENPPPALPRPPAVPAAVAEAVAAAATRVLAANQSCRIGARTTTPRDPARRMPRPTRRARCWDTPCTSERRQPCAVPRPIRARVLPAPEDLPRLEISTPELSPRVESCRHRRIRIAQSLPQIAPARPKAPPRGLRRPWIDPQHTRARDQCCTASRSHPESQAPSGSPRAAYWYAAAPIPWLHPPVAPAQTRDTSPDFPAWSRSAILRNFRPPAAKNYPHRALRRRATIRQWNIFSRCRNPAAQTGDRPWPRRWGYGRNQL